MKAKASGKRIIGTVINFKVGQGKKCKLNIEVWENSLKEQKQ